MRAPVGPTVIRPRRPYRRIALCVLSLGLFTSFVRVPAHAQAPVPTPMTTTWAVRLSNESRCHDDRSLIGMLEAQIPLSQRAPVETAELLAEVTIDAGAARIVVFDRVLAAEAGQREIPLSSRRCHKIADSVSLVLGVLVEAGRGALSTPSDIVSVDGEGAAKPNEPARPNEGQAQAPKEEPKPELAPPVSRATRPKPRPRPVWRGPPSGHDLGVAAGVGVGLLPSVVPGLTLGWGIRPNGTWPIWLQATGWLEAISSNQRGRFSALYAGILTCPLRGERGRLRGRICPGLSFGALWAEGRGFSVPVKSRRPLILGGLEAGGSVKLIGPLEGILMLRAEAVPMRSTFIYRRRDGSAADIHRPSVVVGSAFLGLGLRFR
ncbi:MAG: hypothetical protein ABW252_20285 [Polyangiales bacterium]